MSTQTFFAAALTSLATLAAGSAISGETAYDYPTACNTTVTRDAGKAETLDAIRLGAVSRHERI